MTASTKIYELRTYYATPGKFEALRDRFTNHTLGLFARHGLVVEGFWVPLDTSDTMIYLLSFPSREAAETAWSEFRQDPEWIAAKALSEKDGSLTSGVKSVYMQWADFVPNQ